jgi:hypothetical protein
MAVHRYPHSPSRSDKEAYTRALEELAFFWTEPEAGGEFVQLPSLHEKSGLIAVARSMNRAIAPYCDRASTGGGRVESGTASGDTGNSCSACTWSGSRLVTSTFTPGPVGAGR